MVRLLGCTLCVPEEERPESIQRALISAGFVRTQKTSIA